jgi:3-isopropylmalate/(R)-2-methylmalate dehydratase large subunit
LEVKIVGQTIIEKIMSKNAGKQVKSGDLAWIAIDIRSARDFGGANVVQNFEHEYPGETVADPSKTFFTFDCNVPANTIGYATNQQICRNFAVKHKISLYDVDSGIGSHVMIDQGICRPGQIVVGTDSHLNILGAVGVFGQGMGDQDIAFTFRTGRTWFEVPHTIKVIVTGRLNYPVVAKDLTLRILKELGSKGALGLAIEFCGETIDRLSLDGRITLCSMVTEMGGIVGFINPDKTTIEHFRAKTGISAIQPVEPDHDAKYIRELKIDVTNLEPLVSFPPRPDNVKPVRDSGDQRINSVFIGSCTNGRYEDFKAVADILRGKRVAEGVMLEMVPSTRLIYGRLLKEGIIEQLFDAGAIITHPGCGGCASGQIGMTGKGEVQVSTSNRNFPGKQGAGSTYLASPVTAAASALAGKLCSRM